MNITKAYWSSLLIKKNSKGFTLIELLVAVVMSGIVMAGLGAGMMAVLNSSKKTNAKTDVKNQLNRAVEYINEDIKRSRVAGISSINEPSNKNNAVVLTYFESLNNSISGGATLFGL